MIEAGDVQPGSSVGSVASAEEKHSTSESPESDDPGNAPRANQSTPRSPKQPNSILVEIGFLSLQKPNPRSARMMSRLALHTKIANGTKLAVRGSEGLPPMNEGYCTH